MKKLKGTIRQAPKLRGQINAPVITQGADYVLTDADKQEIAGMVAKEVEIPKSLPNPFPLTINGTSYDGRAAVEMTIEGGGGASGGSENLAVSNTFLYDSGNIVVEAGVVEIDTGISINDLADYETIVFQANVVADPWTSTQVYIRCKNTWGDNAQLTREIGKNLAHFWEFKRFTKGINSFRVVASVRGNGNIVRYPPSGDGTGSYIGTNLTGVAYIDDKTKQYSGYEFDPSTSLRFAINAQTANMNMRFTIIGLTKYV